MLEEGWRWSVCRTSQGVCFGLTGFCGSMREQIMFPRGQAFATMFSSGQHLQQRQSLRSATWPSISSLTFASPTSFLKKVLEVTLWKVFLSSPLLEESYRRTLHGVGVWKKGPQTPTNLAPTMIQRMLSTLLFSPLFVLWIVQSRIYISPNFMWRELFIEQICLLSFNNSLVLNIEWASFINAFPDEFYIGEEPEVSK